MKLNRLALVIIILTALTFSTSAAYYNLIGGEPLGLFNTSFSGYYSTYLLEMLICCVSAELQRGSHAEFLSRAGGGIPQYLSGNLTGLYFETNLAASLQDKAYDPDILTLTPLLL